jgi:predicted RNase H-related nuclease YkuK (DUF458 family)
MPTKVVFKSSWGADLSIEDVVRELIAFMDADRRASYKVTIGSDSEKRKGGNADFVTAIVIHRVGNGGRYFFRRVLIDKKFHTLRDRILEEVLLSLETAKQLVAGAQALTVPPFDFEIHVDVGENGQTRSMIQELVGMIRANNFEARTKPESYAASKVADRHV